MTSNRLTQLFAFLENTPNDSFLLFAIAKEYEKLGDEDNALHFYQKLTETDPNYIGTYYHLGKLQEEMEELAEALSTYETGIQIAKKNKDQHALSELMGAKMNLEIEL
ncbi:MAG: tetratricopeptide repeat protein [Bacteroidota bacterium]